MVDRFRLLLIHFGVCTADSYIMVRDMFSYLLLIVTAVAVVIVSVLFKQLRGTPQVDVIDIQKSIIIDAAGVSARYGYRKGVVTSY